MYFVETFYIIRLCGRGLRKKGDGLTEVRTYISKQLMLAANEAEYDAVVKRILSDKQILAWIMKYAVSEFRSYDIDTIVKCIEGEPEISATPIEPGQTTQPDPEAVKGLNTEDKIPHEGMVTYDIRFAAVTPDGNKVKLIMNVEAQRKYYPGYDLVTRALFYCARMLSAQLDTEFSTDNYDGIKKVYSIWICMHTPNYAKNTITEYHITPNNLFGSFKGKARYDLLSAVMICLGDLGEEGDRTPVLKLLETLLSGDLTLQQKEEILETEFHIPTTVKRKEEWHSMSNLGEGIYEEGVERGIQQGLIYGAADLLKEEGYTAEQIKERIMKKYQLSEEQAQQYLQQN